MAEFYLKGGCYHAGDPHLPVAPENPNPLTGADWSQVHVITPDTSYSSDEVTTARLVRRKL